MDGLKAVSDNTVADIVRNELKERPKGAAIEDEWIEVKKPYEGAPLGIDLNINQKSYPGSIGGSDWVLHITIYPIKKRGSMVVTDTLNPIGTVYLVGSTFGSLVAVKGGADCRSAS